MLCNEVACHTNEWKAIAINLNIDQVKIDRIALECGGNIQDCLVKVFEQWHRQHDPPYTLSTIVEVLELPMVNEVFLAQSLREKYCT